MNSQQETTVLSASVVQPLGMTLRRAREAKGLSLAQAGERLKLRVAIVEAMERDDFQSLGAAVFARGYLTSYAALLGVPASRVDDALKHYAPPAPVLRTTARMPRSRYLFERYARRMVYAVLTAAIVVPVVWLATHDRLPAQRAILTALDAPTVSSDLAGNAPVRGQPAPDAAGLGRLEPVQSGAVEAPGPAASANDASRYPVVASLAPFYSSARTDTDAAAAPAGEPQISFDFAKASWVEIMGRNGERLVYGLIPAGERRNFPVSAIASVTLGDAEAVTVDIGGSAVDLTPYRRVKVARFALSSEGNPAPVVD